MREKLLYHFIFVDHRMIGRAEVSFYRKRLVSEMAAQAQ